METAQEEAMSEHPLSTLERLDPQMMEHLRATNELVYGPGALPKKFKLLLAMAFDAAHGAQGGVRALAKAAMSEGATKEEIAETLRVAYLLSGVGSLYTASLALQEVLP
jgi:alkylhydroperoxidase/carboxymuconolactone decarboxylase family protein YurZ